MAIVLLMTARGIPCIYYGTEQYLHNDTDGGNDPYNRPMMESWATDTPIYKDVHILSDLRRSNPAIALGSQWTKYVTPQVYCFSRRYRDSYAFVAMNQGEQVTLEKVVTDLPDGEYTCLLTRKQFHIKDGHVEQLTLKTKEIIVLSYIGQSVQEKTIVRVQVNGVQTQPGDTVVMLGDCPELGDWDITKACPLEYINANTWFGEVDFNESVGKAINYKYAIWRNNAVPIRENLVRRSWVLPEEGIVKWRDMWSQ
jgi:cyclomaltodextrin glucanotransferase